MISLLPKVKQCTSGKYTTAITVSHYNPPNKWPQAVLCNVTCTSWTMAAEQHAVILRGPQMLLQTEHAGFSTAWKESRRGMCCPKLPLQTLSHCCCFLIKDINSTRAILYLVVVKSQFVTFPPIFLIKDIKFMLTCPLRDMACQGNSGLPAFLDSSE